jgi:hypothetical protein
MLQKLRMGCSSLAGLICLFLVVKNDLFLCVGFITKPFPAELEVAAYENMLQGLRKNNALFKSF